MMGRQDEPAQLFSSSFRILPRARMLTVWPDHVELNEVAEPGGRGQAAKNHELCTKIKSRLEAGFSGAEVRCIVGA
jgi:hypothetical protein